MFKKNIIKKVIALTLAISQPLTANFVIAQANSFQQAGRESQSFGKELLNTFQMPSMSGDNINLHGGAGPLNINDLFPGTSENNTNPNDYYFPDGYDTNVDGAKSIHDSNSQMNTQGYGSQETLWNDAHSSQPSMQGSAYGVILDSSNLSRPDMTNDPIFNQTKDVYNNMSVFSSQFGDCSEDTKFSIGSRPVSMPDYKTCEKLIKPEGQCELTHDVDIRTATADVHLASQGRDVVTGRFDLRNGSWSIIQPSDGDQKTGAVTRVNFDDLCGGGYLSEQTKTIGTWDWTGHGLGGKIDTSVIYDVLQHPSCGNGLVAIVQIRDTDLSDDTEYILAGKFSFEMAALKRDEWSPKECVEEARYLDGAFCRGETEIYAGAPKGDCYNFGSVRVCPGDPIYNAMQEPPSSSLGKLFLHGRLPKFQCDYNIGDMECYVDVHGEQHCHNNTDEGVLNTCEEFEENPSCGFISSQCVEGATGLNGKCYIYEEKYDCGYNVDVETLDKKTNYQCAGPIRCMGDECIDVPNEKNEDFAQVAALLNAAQFMGQDMDCKEAEYNPNDDNPQTGCKVFPGTAGKCKKAVGGAVNCCKSPGGVSLADYMTLLLATPKLDAGMMWLAKNNYAIGSSYASMKGVVVDSFTEITKPFAGGFDSISSSVGAVKDSINKVMTDIGTKIDELFSKVFGNLAGEAGGQLGGEAGKSVAATFMETGAGQALQFISTVYTIYSVTMLVIKIIFQCTKDELELTVKRQLKSCTHLGSYCHTKIAGVCIEKRESYCCYSSPLSRIIQEQVKPQLGLSNGSPKNPQCEGLPIERFSEVNWDSINLDEWLGILQETGNWPSLDTLNIPYLTGEGTTLDFGGRNDAAERAVERLDGSTVDKTRQRVTETYAPHKGQP